MDYLGGYEQFVSNLWMINLASELKFHISLYDHDNLIYFMHEIYPALTRRIDPQIARKTSFCPFPCDFITIDFRHRYQRIFCPTAGAFSRGEAGFILNLRMAFFDRRRLNALVSRPFSE